MAQMMATASPAGAAPDPVRAAHDELLRHSELQFEFARRVEPEPPNWLKRLGELFQHLGPVMEVLFWAVLAAMAGFLLFVLLREIWRRMQKETPHTPAPQWQPKAAGARALLADADRLAAEGRHAEAVHLLLFRSLDDIEAWRPRLLKPALTARDIAALDVLPGAARRAFAHIAQVVERSFFGGGAVDALQYQACRDAYAGFALREAGA